MLYMVTSRSFLVKSPLCRITQKTRMLLAAGLAALTLSACATKPPASNAIALAAYEEANDPLEPFNRAMFKVDLGADRVLVRPIIKVYRFIVPAQGRRGLGNFAANLRSPVVFINDLLQGEVSRAGTTLGRFVVNTGMGFFGFFDVGTKLGMARHSEDFGQTLAVWGLGNGPFVYVPLLGPTTVRDGFGFGVDAFFTDPIAWYSRGDGAEGWVGWTSLGLAYITTKDGVMDPLDELRRSSLDYYAALRSSYRQIRASEIRNGAPPPLEDFD
jgi:phospholipid-binding lipoprotein MlaA